MSGQERKQQAVTRRGVLLTTFMVAPFSVLLGRLYVLQVIAGKEYRRLSEQNRISLRLVVPKRGKLLDRYGKILADNKKSFRLVMIPEQASEPAKLLRRVAQVIKLEVGQQLDVLKRIGQSPSFVSVSIKNFLTFDEVARAQVNLPELPGVDVEEIEVREYPHGSVGAHVYGYMGPATLSQLKQSTDPLLKMPDFRVGRRSLEQVLDKRLRGKAGTNQVEVNALGREVRIISQQPPQEGEAITLSLSSRLQQVAWDELGDRRGAIVALDTQTGDVLTMVSSPSFNPNDFVYGISDADWRQLQNDPRKPLIDRCCKGTYAPGSTFKMLVALAALEEGLVTPEEKILCTGHMEFGGRRFHCWKESGHGEMDLQHAIAHSCDIYFYEMGRRLGVDTIARYAQMFGLGESTGILLTEDDGLIATTSWKKQTKGVGWRQGESLITAIGQGYTLATPLQLAVMGARLATGRAVRPHLEAYQSIPDYTELAISPENLAVVQQAMWDVVNRPYGTAFGSRLRHWKFGGKTGTSQVVSRRQDEESDQTKVPENERTHALFVGFGPIPDPRVAICVILENAGSGSHVAAPVARNVLAAAFRELQV